VGGSVLVFADKLCVVMCWQDVPEATAVTHLYLACGLLCFGMCRRARGECVAATRHRYKLLHKAEAGE
jgi:hypothetical protein